MNTFVIDTHKSIQKLTQSGFSQEQAEGIVDVLTESDLVTKTYIDHALALLEARLTNKLYAVGLSIAAIVLAVAVLF